MLDIIKSMIVVAEVNHDYDQLENIRELIYKLADTWNCPRNWRDIGEILAKEYDSDSEIYNTLSLWNYIDEED